MLFWLPPRNFIPAKYTDSNIIYLSLSIFFYKYTGSRTGTGTTGARWYSLASEKRNLTPALTNSTNFTYTTFICASDCGDRRQSIVAALALIECLKNLSLVQDHTLSRATFFCDSRGLPTPEYLAPLALTLNHRNLEKE
jgi:hypothetical protein